MSFKTIEKEIIDKFSSRIQIVPDGTDRFRVHTPFSFGDGDHLAIVLKNENGQWVFSDEGYTYMHLTLDIDEEKLFSGTRHKIISSALSAFELKDRDGELILEVQDGDYGAALYSFAQSLIRISDVSYLSLFREQPVRRTFKNDVRRLLERSVPVGSMKRNWIHPEDRKQKYKVDYRINGQPKPPLLVYALSNDNNVQAATIALHQFKSWKLEFISLGILKNPTPKIQKSLDWFLDVGDTYCDLVEGRERIQEYFA